MLRECFEVERDVYVWLTVARFLCCLVGIDDRQQLCSICFCREWQAVEVGVHVSK